MAYKAVLLDRDDTLIEDPGYINSPEQIKLINGVAESLIELRHMGYKLVIVSNQSAVARGIVTEEVLEKIHHRLKEILRLKGANVDAIYYCPYHPEGVIEKYRKKSENRKPNPGMLLKAAKEMDLDLKNSWMIGNSERDIEAGLRAGCKTIMIDTPSHNRRFKTCDVEPDFQAVNMKEAVNIIKKATRSTNKEPVVHRTTSATTHVVSQIIEDTLIDDKKQLGEKIMNTEQAVTTSSMQGKKNDYSSEAVEQLLGEILMQLKKADRKERFGDFSGMRLLSGTVQVLVLFCLLISGYFLLLPNKDINGIMISLGFAAVFQLMSLTLYIMDSWK